MTKPRDPRSPYARKGKAPYKYSEHYQRWADAVARNDTQAVIEADFAFRRAFGVPFSREKRR